MKLPSLREIFDTQNKLQKEKEKYNETPTEEGFKIIQDLSSEKRSRARHFAHFVATEFNEEFAGYAMCPKDTMAVQSSDEYFSYPGWCLVLSGGVGAGKTIAAVNLLGQFSIENDDEFRILFSSDVACIPIFGKEGEDYFRDVCEIEVLLIDDLGAEIDTPGSRAFFSRLIDFRHRRKLTTIITTNLALKAWAERYGSRIVDRISDNSTIIELPNKSMRGEK